MQTLTISEGLSKNATSWRPVHLTWPELCERLSHTRMTNETEAEYAAMDRESRGRIKDVGGFVGGEFKDGIRRGSNLLSRQILSLDIDYGKPDTWDVVDGLCDLYDWTCLMHTTHSHTREKPRYRLYMPLSRDVDKIEYEAVGRMVASLIDIELFDDTTYQASRLMFWPSTCRDGEFIVKQRDGAFVDVDEVLGMYADYKNRVSWPISSRTMRTQAHEIKDKQQDPRSKNGIVGAFCSVYDVHQAISKFLGKVYSPCEGMPNRYTFIGASTTAGLVVYDDGLFAYSHHESDPCHGRTCNAFDLVRLHLYPDSDEGRSFEKMKSLISSDSEVRHKLEDMIQINASRDFADGGDADILRRDDRDYTESGNAIRLKDSNFNVMRYSGALDWCVWDGAVWQQYAKTDAIMLVMCMNDRMKDEADRKFQLAPKPEKGCKRDDWPEDYKDAVAAVKWATASRSYNVMAHTLQAAQSLMSVRDADEFDNDPWLLNTPDSVIDLRTGEEKPHRAEYMCTMMTRLSPDFTAQRPLWDKFMRQVTGDDADFAEYIQTVAGMALVGKVYEEGLLLVYGNGGNGKSTLFSVWHTLLGGYAATVRNEVLTGSRNGSEVAGQNLLRGKRLVLTSELEANQAMQSSMLKRLTSQDPISANVKFHEPITFTPSHTLILHTNHLPRLKSVDGGTARRIAVAPFNMSLKPEEKIMDFAGVLVEKEGPAILAWMIEGAMKFYAQHMKLKKPKVVLEATKEYLDNEDVITRFVNECCSLDNADARTPTGLVFQTFTRWMQESGMKWYGGDREFKKKMQEKGFEYCREKKGVMLKGVEVIDPTFENENL